ncbi:MAG: sigma-70 family RNA polymerase sigma factor [Anaerolineae bacterium]
MAQDGDRAAFETLCDRYLPIVYNRLRALLPVDVVEDVAQEVFIAVLRGLERFEGRSSFRTWVSAICRYKSVDYYRESERQPSTVPLEAAPNHQAQMAEWEERTLVRIALRRLPAHYQEILLLRFADGLLFRQIAEELDISLEAAKSRYRRAAAAAAEELGPKGA